MRLANELVSFCMGVAVGVFSCGLYEHSGNMTAGAVGAFVVLGLLKLTIAAEK